MCKVLLLKHNKDVDRESGDIIAVLPDTHQWGMRENKEVWLKAGKPEKDYPDHFRILEFPGLSEADFKAKMIAATGVPLKNKHMIDVTKLDKKYKDKVDAGEDVISIADLDNDILKKSNIAKIKASGEEKSKIEHQKTKRWTDKVSVIKEVKGFSDAEIEKTYKYKKLV